MALPLWQFDSVEPSVLPDLDVLQSAFPGGVDFDDRTPRTEMVQHGSRPVVVTALIESAPSVLVVIPHL